MDLTANRRHFSGGRVDVRFRAGTDADTASFIQKRLSRSTSQTATGRTDEGTLPSKSELHGHDATTDLCQPTPVTTALSAAPRVPLEDLVIWPNGFEPAADRLAGQAGS